MNMDAFVRSEKSLVTALVTDFMDLSSIIIWSDLISVHTLYRKDKLIEIPDHKKGD